MSRYCTGTFDLQRNAPTGMRLTTTITLLQYGEIRSGVCGQRGSGGKALSASADAMPTRSAPSALARRFTRAASHGAPRSESTGDRIALAPDRPRHRPDQRELPPLVLLGHRRAADRRAEAALRAEREALERHERRRLVDPPAERVRRLERRGLAAHQPEHDTLVRRHEPQRPEIAGALAVVFEQEHVDAALPEELLRDRLVAAGADPVTAVVPAAEMHADGHAGRTVAERLGVRPQVPVEERTPVPAPLRDQRLDPRVAEERDWHLVELEVSAAEARELGDLGPIHRDQVAPPRFLV